MFPLGTHFWTVFGLVVGCAAFVALLVGALLGGPSHRRRRPEERHPQTIRHAAGLTGPAAMRKGEPPWPRRTPRT